MVISKAAQAGSSETSDILIMVSPNPDGGIKLELDSKKVILKQFGKQIEKVIREKIAEMGVKDIMVIAKDNGALDYTIRARVQAAIERAI
ncbi:MAG TPA: citrate lyase acyl carrier protein [Peptococcaceae bacterium]|nr:citrate lyase acyl carrier protein [Peptococcaceae bacterium]